MNKLPSNVHQLILNHAKAPLNIISILLSIALCFFILFFSKYDTWGLSEDICIYHNSSAVTALVFTTILFIINFLSLFLKNKNLLVHGVFIGIAIGLFIYWHSSIYINLVSFLTKYVGIQLEQLGQAAVCEWQRHADLRTLGIAD